MTSETRVNDHLLAAVGLGKLEEEYPLHALVSIIPAHQKYETYRREIIDIGEAEGTETP